MNKKPKPQAMKSSIWRLLVLSGITVAIMFVLTLFCIRVVAIHSPVRTATLDRGDVLVSLKQKKIKRGDLIAFSYDNKVLIRRCIGIQGDWIDIDKNGAVSVNFESLKENYISNQSKGNADIQFPYQVPENRYFVLSDSRDVLSDSRNSAIGCISEQQIVGNLLFRVWPLNRLYIF
ncbi:Signal peptidase I [Lachnospiraceae bacterium TWA4]|nr:Signal peptidase I [Lachnospiraceae bacterium TWA4]